MSEHNVRTTGEAAYGKAVWFWHPLLVSSRRRKIDPTGFRQSFNPPATEARGIRLRGERGISRQTIAQGMPECSSCTCMLVCVSSHLLHTRPRVQRASGIPCSLSFEGQRHANLGQVMLRERGRVSAPTSSFRGAHSANPESMLPIMAMDSGSAPSTHPGMTMVEGLTSPPSSAAPARSAPAPRNDRCRVRTCRRAW